MREVTRQHDFCYGHRVFGHEGACSHLHGHNARVTFHVTAPDLDDVGRLIDFAEIGRRLGGWLEVHWDHRFLIWEDDPLAPVLSELDPTVVWLSFNPTAENLAHHLLHRVGPHHLKGTGSKLVAVRFEETRKCAAYESLPSYLEATGAPTQLTVRLGEPTDAA